MDIQLPITSQQWLKGYKSSTSSFCFGVFFQNVEQGHKLKGALFVAKVSERNWAVDGEVASWEVQMQKKGIAAWGGKMVSPLKSQK